MKVLFLNPTGALGGAEKVLLGVMTAVRHAQPDAKLHLLSLSSGPLVEKASQRGVDVTVCPLPAALASLGDSQLVDQKNQTRRMVALASHALKSGGAAWDFLRCFRHKVRQLRPDLIHSNGIKTHALASMAGIDKTPILWHVHDFFGARPLARKFLGFASRRIGGMIAISRAVADDLQTLWPEITVRVVSNTVDVHEYSPAFVDGHLLDQLAGLPPGPADCLRVGLIATYARWKGHEVFLEAAARVIKANPDRGLRFYIVGGPIYTTRGSQFDVEELRALARHFGINGYVGFIGFQKDVVSIYRALDVVVHASTSPEPFGMTIIEAMACGKPVIASLAGGACEIVQPDHDALGTPPRRPQALADALTILLENDSLRQELGRNARETVCLRFNQDRLGPQVLTAYREFNNNCPGPGFIPNIRNLHDNLKSFS